MRKVIGRVILLMLLFLASVFVSSRVFNRGETLNTADYSPASLPVLHMQLDGLDINPMYGYTARMQEDTLRDSLTLITTDRQLTVVIDLQGAEVSGLSYRVSAPDYSETIEEKKLSLNAEKEGQISVSFKLDEPILMNQEYPLRFTVNLADGQKVYYYTHLIQRAGLNVTKYLEFVCSFYEKCINKDAARSLTTYLESAGDTTDTDLSHTTLTATFDKVTWGSLKPQIQEKAIPVIHEINETTCSITLEYILSARPTEDDLEYYRVHEYYRMRYARSRIMLLDFDRTTEQIMDETRAEVTAKGLKLGVFDKDTPVTCDINADQAAFVQAGDLYSFHRTSSRLCRIFSFRTGEVPTLRETNSNHKIKVIRVSENGDVEFMVIGYMNSDRYEGRMGVAVYHYDAQANITKEQLFIPCDVSLECLENDLNDFAYVTNSNILYIRIDQRLYKIDLNDGTQEILLENIQNSCFATSATLKTIAWMKEQDPNASRSLVIMDLETGISHEVAVDAGQYLRILGFLNEDVVYGVADEMDIMPGVFAMKHVLIRQFDGTLKKDYQKDNIWVVSATVDKAYIELSRVRRNKSGIYKATDMDRIVNNVELNNDKALLSLTADERQGKACCLSFTQTMKGEQPVVVTTKYTTASANEELQVTLNGYSDNVFRIYSGGALTGQTTDPAQAILIADEVKGTVVNSTCQYIWERGNRPDTAPPNVDALPQNILSIPQDTAQCQEALGDGFVVMDLTGCTLSQVLYFVAQGRAVVAQTPDGPALIVGYDYYNVRLYNPASGEVTYGGMNDSTALFEQAGNRFISYVEKYKK